jgi:hypothetical protein
MEDIEKYIDSIDRRTKTEYRGITRHKKKDGTMIMVDVIADSIVTRKGRTTYFIQ